MKNESEDMKTKNQREDGEAEIRPRTREKMKDHREEEVLERRWRTREKIKNQREDKEPGWRWRSEIRWITREMIKYQREEKESKRKWRTRDTVRLRISENTKNQKKDEEPHTRDQEPRKRDEEQELERRRSNHLLPCRRASASSPTVTLKSPKI